MKKEDVKTWHDGIKLIPESDKKQYNRIVYETVQATYDSLEDEEKAVINSLLKEIGRDYDGIGLVSLLEMMAACSEYFKDEPNN